MRRLASWIRPSTRCSPPLSSELSSRSAAAARPDASSPACAPPIPSATAKSGGSPTYASSLCRRRRPVSVTLALRPSALTRLSPHRLRIDRSFQTDTRAKLARPDGGIASDASRVVPQLGLADAQDVARGEALRARQSDPVQVGALRRTDVLDPHAVAAGFDPRVVGRGVLVAGEVDVVARAAAEQQRRRVEHQLVVLVERRALHHHQAPALDLRLLLAEPWHRAGREHEALLRHAHVARGRAHDPPDEEVEQDEERELEDEQRLFDRDGADPAPPSVSRLNTSSVEPSVIRSPCRSFARFWRRPFTSIPFVEPRSTAQYAAPSCRTSACLRETFGSASWMSQSFERPIVARPPSSSCLVPLKVR